MLSHDNTNQGARQLGIIFRLPLQRPAVERGASATGASEPRRGDRTVDFYRRLRFEHAGPKMRLLVSGFPSSSYGGRREEKASTG